MNVRVGAQIQPQHAGYEDTRRAPVEEPGAYTLFTRDHFFPLYGGPEGRRFEFCTLLAAIAEVTRSTQRVEFGALVACDSYRNANLLARRAPHPRGRVDP